MPQTLRTDATIEDYVGYVQKTFCSNNHIHSARFTLTGRKCPKLTRMNFVSDPGFVEDAEY